MHDEAQLILEACPEIGKDNLYLPNGAQSINFFGLKKQI
jgi:hypothetical protein